MIYLKTKIKLVRSARRVVKVFIVELTEHRQYNCIVMSIHFMAKENNALQSYLWLS